MFSNVFNVSNQCSIDPIIDEDVDGDEPHDTQHVLVSTLISRVRKDDM